VTLFRDPSDLLVDHYQRLALGDERQRALAEFVGVAAIGGAPEGTALN
jgi:hypothetical protein